MAEFLSIMQDYVLSHICVNASTITYQNITVKFLLIKVLDKEIYFE